MANFMLSYDPHSAAPIQKQLTAYIKTSRNITQWVMPYIGLYLIKSNSGLNVLAQDFREFFGECSHVLSPILPNYIQGILPPHFWTWLNQAETNALATLFLGSNAITGNEGGQ